MMQKLWRSRVHPPIRAKDWTSSAYTDLPLENLRVRKLVHIRCIIDSINDRCIHQHSSHRRVDPSTYPALRHSPKHDSLYLTVSSAFAYFAAAATAALIFRLDAVTILFRPPCSERIR